MFSLVRFRLEASQIVKTMLLLSACSFSNSAASWSSNGTRTPHGNVAVEFAVLQQQQQQRRLLHNNEGAGGQDVKENARMQPREMILGDSHTHTRCLCFCCAAD